jgi:hypothetical protein
MFHPATLLNVPRGTFKSNGASVDHFKRNLLIVLTLLALIVVIIKPDFYSFFQKSLEERSLGYKVFYNNSIIAFAPCPKKNSSTPAHQENVPCGTFSGGWNNFKQFRGGIFKNHPILGIGNGQFVLEMQKYIFPKLQDWQFQPVHNVFLLILSELGLVGLGLFIWFLWKVFHVEHFKCHSGLDPESNKILNQVQDDKEKKTFFKSILLSFIFIMLFDHYLWDIQQGQILLWLTFGLIVGEGKEIFDKE